MAATAVLIIHAKSSSVATGFRENRRSIGGRVLLFSHTVGCKASYDIPVERIQFAGRLHPDHRREAGGTGPESHRLHDDLQRSIPRAAAALQGRQQVTIDIHNQTDTPEQLHWHGQFLSTDVDGAAEEGTPFIPPHGSRRITFVPKPSGYRFYHTHVRAGANLSAGQYTGLVGPVYIEPKNNPGNYDREIFLTLKEFEPTLSRGGDMDMNFLSPATTVKDLKDIRRKRHESLARKGHAAWIRGRV